MSMNIWQDWRMKYGIPVILGEIANVVMSLSFRELQRKLEIKEKKFTEPTTYSI